MMNSKYFVLSTSLQIIRICFLLTSEHFFSVFCHNNTFTTFIGFQKGVCFLHFVRLPVRQFITMSVATATWEVSGKAWYINFTASSQVYREICKAQKMGGAAQTSNRDSQKLINEASTCTRVYYATKMLILAQLCYSIPIS